jgi:hypothetical protein
MSGILQGLIGSLKSAASATTDAFFNLVTLLLNTTSTNGAQNNTFLDASTNNFSITRNGNTTQGTFTPFSQTGWSNFFDGTGDGFSYSGTTFGSGAWTVELWFYFTGSSFTGPIGFFEGTTDSLTVQIMSSTAIRVDEVNVSNDSYTVPAMSANTWYHVAVTKDASGNQTLFLNGVRSSTGVTTTLRNFSTATLRVGYSTIGATDFTGYISNLRFVTGSAVYDPLLSTITVPTTPLTAISGTQLLTCQSNRFVDNSTNAFSLTANGTPSVQAFSPFLPTIEYDAAVVGGSAFFDGTGDNLTWTGTAAGSGAFSYEFWLYSIVAFSSNRAPLGVISTSGYNTALDVRMSGTTINMSAYNTANNNFTVPALVPYTWYHVVLCRNASNQATVFLNGVRSSTGVATITQNFAGLTSVIGAQDTTSDPGERTTGYLTDVRLIVGSTPYDPTASTITVPTAPLTAIANTQLLTKSTNAGIFDSAAKNDLETRGNAQVSTTQAKWGTTSMYFAADGDFLTTPHSPNLVFGTGDFTFECQLYWTGGANENNLIMNNANGGFNVKLSATTAANWGLDNAYVAQVADFGTAPTKNVWHHLAVTRASGTLYAFIDGTQVFSGANSTNFTNTATWYIASNGFSSTFRITGYIDDLRITKGYARYTASFTPPAAAFPLL